MWGVQKVQKNKLILGKYKDLTQSEFVKYDRKLSELGPSRNKIDKIDNALNFGIPFEFLVDKKILELQDVDYLDITPDTALEIKEFIAYRTNPSAFIQQKKVFVVINSDTEYSKFSSQYSDLGLDFVPLKSIDEIGAAVESHDLDSTFIFILAVNLEKDLLEDIEYTYSSLVDSGLQFAVIDLGYNLKAADHVYFFNELSSKIAGLLFKDDYTSLMSLSGMIYDEEKAKLLKQTVETAEEVAEIFGTDVIETVEDSSEELDAVSDVIDTVIVEEDSIDAIIVEDVYEDDSIDTVNTHELDVTEKIDFIEETRDDSFDDLDFTDILEDTLNSIDTNEFIQISTDPIEEDIAGSSPIVIEGSEDSTEISDSVIETIQDTPDSQLEESIDAVVESDIVPEQQLTAEHSLDIPISVHSEETSNIQAVTKSKETHGISKINKDQFEFDLVSETSATIGFSCSPNTSLLEFLNIFKKSIDASHLQIIEELNTKISSQDKDIQSLEGRLTLANTSLSEMSEMNKKLRSKIQDLTLDIRGLSDENVLLKDIQLKFNSIIDEYKSLLLLKQNHDTIISELTSEHNQKLADLKIKLNNQDSAYNELKSNYEKLFDIYQSGDSIPVSKITYMATLDKPIFYFNIVDEINYFNTMLSALISDLKRSHKVLVVAVKSLKDIEQAEWSTWGTITSGKDFILLDSFDNKIAKQLETIAQDYELVIALDYICGKTKFVKSLTQSDYDVVRSKRRQTQLGLNNTLISSDSNSYIDLNFDEKISTMSNKMAKEIYFIRSKHIDKFKTILK